MPVVTLNITERFPLVSSKEPGPKTLFVKAVQNWPAAVGQQDPCIPLDILVGIDQFFGDSIVSNDVIQLPNVGLSTVVMSDKVNVWVEYTNAQGLAVPYAQYMIAGTIVPGKIEKLSGGYSWKSLQTLAPAPLPAVGNLPIPDFSREFRVVSGCFGQMSLYERPGVGAGNRWVQFWDLAEVQQWTFLPPLASEFNIALFAAPYSATPYPADINVLFRC